MWACCLNAGRLSQPTAGCRLQRGRCCPGAGWQWCSVMLRPLIPRVPPRLYCWGGALWCTPVWFNHVRFRSRALGTACPAASLGRRSRRCCDMHCQRVVPLDSTAVASHCSIVCIRMWCNFGRPMGMHCLCFPTFGAVPTNFWQVTELRWVLVTVYQMSVTIW